MVIDDLLADLITYAGEDYDYSQEPLLSMLLEDAIEEVVNHMYPFGASNAETAREKALNRYKGAIRRIAEYHYDKIGKEGVTHFNENGSYGTYEASGTPPSYFVGIMPVARVI